MFKDALRLYRHFNKRRKFQIILLFVGMIVVSALEFISVSLIPLFVLTLNQVDRIIERPAVTAVMQFFGVSGPVEFIYLFCAFIIGAFLLRGIGAVVMARAQAGVSSAIASDLSGDLFHAIMKAPYTYLTTKNTSHFVNIILSEVSRATQQYIGPCLQLFLDLFILVALILIVLISDPFIGLGIAVFAGVGGFLYMRSSRARLSHLGREISLQNRNMIQKINEGLGGYKHVKLRNLDSEIIGEFNTYLARRDNAAESMKFIQDITKPIFETSGLILLIVVTIILINSGKTIDLIVPMLTMLGAVAVRALPALFGIIRSAASMRGSAPAVHGILAEFDALSAFSIRSGQSEKTPSLPLAMGDIAVRDLTVRYPTADKNILSRLNLDIKAHTSVAFVGPTGSGKSTLIDTLLGFIEPLSGDIRIGNVSVRSDMSQWRAKIGYIPQAIFLSDASIRKNVAFGVPDGEIDDRQVWSALEDAQLASFVKDLPEGLDTTVGERGVRLSGGQRQRIGIARALYHAPEVLVLDEATSALDQETEAKVISAIESARRNRTLIMIAHRLSTVQNCDAIFFLSGGHVLASGTYSELCERSAQFRKMAGIQED